MTPPSARTSGSTAPVPPFLENDQFTRFDRTAHSGEGVAHKRMERQERGANGVGRQNERQWPVGEHGAAGFDHAGQVVEQLPDLAFRPAPEGRWIEKHDVVAAAAPDFALDEQRSVLAKDPVDRFCPAMPARSGFRAPSRRFFRRV
ncbi:MAG: hypothetical protein IPL47_02375, partial [Phyllobacteriaceae bacterium]|nr:hypothetical protein [Phyllobacteriaceae bacterium]